DPLALTTREFDAPVADECVKAHASFVITQIVDEAHGLCGLCGCFLRISLQNWPNNDLRLLGQGGVISINQWLAIHVTR
ncbi:MAG: hypothetical protein ACI901_001698, partial [Octadecabacter sp.]